MAQTKCHNCGYPWAVADDNCPNCGAHNSGCFITTSVCQSLGKEDDCSELQILRAFRDDYVASVPDGKREIEHYYKVSPLIVNNINALPNRDAVLSLINEKHLKPAIELILNGRNHEAYLRYKRMVNDLEEIYG
ncbi:MAG: hypothetical protein RL517_254 [Pseudomonadota bacterium]